VGIFAFYVIDIHVDDLCLWLQTEDDGGEGTPVAHKRSPEDLAMYNHLFPELFEIESSGDLGTDSIMIPTGSNEGVGAEKGAAGKSGGIYPLTVDSLRKSSSGHAIYRMQTCVSDYTDTSGYSSGRTGTYSGEVDYIDSYGRSETVANLKSGANVISIDFPTSQSSKSSGSKKPGQKSKKAKGSKRPGKDRKPKKSLTKDTSDTIASFTSSLCITPIPAITDPDEDLDTAFAYEDEEDVFDQQHDPQMYQEVARLTRSVYRYTLWSLTSFTQSD